MNCSENCPVKTSPHMLQDAEAKRAARKTSSGPTLTAEEVMENERERMEVGILYTLSWHCIDGTPVEACVRTANVSVWLHAGRLAGTAVVLQLSPALSTPRWKPEAIERRRRQQRPPTSTVNLAQCE